MEGVSGVSKGAGILFAISSSSARWSCEVMLLPPPAPPAPPAAGGLGVFGFRTKDTEDSWSGAKRAEEQMPRTKCPQPAPPDFA